MGSYGEGAKVEVRTGFDRAWAPGFEVVDECPVEGYLLRRLSDGRTLPRRFASDEVRRARRDDGMWWF